MSNLDLDPEAPRHLHRVLADPAKREAIEAQGTVGWDDLWDRIKERYSAPSDETVGVKVGGMRVDATPGPDGYGRALEPRRRRYCQHHPTTSEASQARATSPLPQPTDRNIQIACRLRC